jgi:ABC-2 type transport system permease protein
MNNSRLLSLIRKEFIQISRDPRTLMMVVLIPVMQLFLLGYAATSDVRNVPMAVFDQDRSPASRALLDAYRAADYFEISFDLNTESKINELIDSGEAVVGLIIPPNYSSEITGNGKTEVVFVFDGSDPSVASTALAAAHQIGQQHGTDILAKRMEQAGFSDVAEVPLEVRSQVWYNPDLQDAYFMVPGLIGMILWSLTSILTASAIVREKERGTIEQLIVTPIRSWELVVGKIIPYVIIALFNTVEVLLIGSLWFKVPMNSGVGLVLVLSSLFLLTSLGIGLLASTVAETQQEAMVTVFTSMLPSMMLSGYFFPIEAMPIWLQYVSYFIPLRYYLTIIRALLLKGVGIASLQQEIIALVIFGVGFMTLAALRFRKRLD